MSTQLDVPARRRSRRLTVAATAAGVAAVAVAGLLLADGLGPGRSEALELELPGAGGEIAGSCVPFTVETLADMSPAFLGTATAVDGNRATLRVDQWYVGGDASEVVVTVPDGAHIALNGTISFAEGEQYLITAVDGTVNLCGYSGEATPELRQAFDAAF